MRYARWQVIAGLFSNKPQRTLTSYGVGCLLRPRGVQILVTMLCVLCALCGLKSRNSSLAAGINLKLATNSKRTGTNSLQISIQSVLYFNSHGGTPHATTEPNSIKSTFSACLLGKPQRKFAMLRSLCCSN